MIIVNQKITMFFPSKETKEKLRLKGLKTKKKKIKLRKIKNKKNKENNIVIIDEYRHPIIKL